MALLPGSPAIDAGTSGAGIPTTDQRGLGRVGAVDIGAFESQGFTLTPVAGSTPQTAKIGTAFANPLAVTVTANNPIEPVNGGVVSFVANRAVTGATAILLAPSAVIAGGQAAVTAAPNNVVGSYTVVASATGSSPASFALTNAGPVFTSLVVNTTSDSLVPGAGLLSLREAIAFANTRFLGNLDHHLRQARLRHAADDHPDRQPARAEQHERDGDDHGPGGGRDGQRRRAEPGVPGRRGRHGVDLGTDDHRRQLCRLRRRPVQLRARLTLTNCTVSGNSAGIGGGGLCNSGGTATLTNCTVSGNSASGDGGGAVTTTARPR